MWKIIFSPLLAVVFYHRLAAGELIARRPKLPPKDEITSFLICSMPMIQLNEFSSIGMHFFSKLIIEDKFVMVLLFFKSLVPKKKST